MATAIADVSTNEPITGRDRAVDAVRGVAHAAHEARLLRALASDALEDGVHAAKRAVKRSIHEAEDLRDAAAYRVKRAPLTAVGLAFGVGALLGVVVAGITWKVAARK